MEELNEPYCTEEEMEEYVSKLTDNELCIYFKGDREWFESGDLTRDNILYVATTEYLEKHKKNFEPGELGRLVIYEMAVRFNKEKSPGN